jgi:hypothetical protein
MNECFQEFIKQNGPFIGLVIVLTVAAILFLLTYVED